MSFSGTEEEKSKLFADIPHHVVNAIVGNLVLECGFAEHSLREITDSINSTFSEEHSHSCFELLIQRRGEGFQFVSGQAYAYSDGSVFLFAPFVRHAHISHAADPEIRCSIRFDVKKEQPFDAASRNVASEVIRHVREHGFFHFTANDAILAMLDRLLNVIEDDCPYASLSISGTLSALLSYAFREVSIGISRSGDAFPASWSASASLDRRKFIIDHFFDQLVNSNARMEDLCREVHLSQSQLARSIREIYGTTFKQKLIDVRIAYIKYFLRYSDMSVHEIALRAGFQETSNFSLFFKQHCGETPTQYRGREQSARE